MRSILSTRSRQVDFVASRFCQVAVRTAGPVCAVTDFSVGAMSAVHTVTVVSVSVSVWTSLMAPIDVSFNTARIFGKHSIDHKFVLEGGSSWGGGHSWLLNNRYKPPEQAFRHENKKMARFLLKMYFWHLGRGRAIAPLPPGYAHETQKNTDIFPHGRRIQVFEQALWWLRQCQLNPVYTVKLAQQASSSSQLHCVNSPLWLTLDCRTSLWTLTLWFVTGFNVGAMSAVHTVTVVSVSVSVWTSLMAPTDVSFTAARISENTGIWRTRITFHVDDGFSCSNKHCGECVSVSSDCWTRLWTLTSRTKPEHVPVAAALDNAALC